MKSGVLGRWSPSEHSVGGNRSQQDKTRRTQREGGIQLSLPTHKWFRGMDHKWRSGLVKKMIGLVLNMLDLGSSWND